ncbi:MAG: Rieske 2Fe-2S domain-containing protein [Actinobacteria bacterium]|nr:Rieske 2Fe-2S domain-containing protein [Actinomycetota bacterium]
MLYLKNYFHSVISSWRVQSPSVRIIRLWLGVTWIYGGWDKAIDPGFLAKTGATSIARQLEGYSQSSPLGFLFQHLIERANLVGVIVMISEFAIGLATLFWVAPTLFAFSGFAMSIGLWLSATWHVQPYFLGSDTAYAILWLAYLLAVIGARRKIDISLDRRGTIRLGLVGAFAVMASAVGRVLQQSPKGDASALNANATGAQILASSKLAVGANHEFTTTSGEPAILFRTAVGVFAYSEICTHQGCTVSYLESERSLRCPCHGASFDPFNGAAVKAGPALSPLPSIKVVEESGWIVYA